MDYILDIFENEKSCEYRGEKYRARDNGSVYRFSNLNKRKRPLDEIWTFGKPDRQNGYLNFSSETVHRIVSTAFHGAQPSAKHVVDHIDTNKKNNRPENLRWVTKLENILINPNTLNKIIYKYGSIDYFLANPSKPIVGELDQNFDWMRTVTKEESENTKNNLISLAKEGKISKGGSLGEWIHLKLNPRNSSNIEENAMIKSLTPNAIQKNWKTQCEFPYCPSLLTENSIKIYKEKLVKGSIFSNNKYGKSLVENSVITENGLLVLTSNDNIKPYALAKVYIEKNMFIHESIGSFFKLDGANKGFILEQGLKWEGGETFDDLVN